SGCTLSPPPAPRLRRVRPAREGPTRPRQARALDGRVLGLGARREIAEIEAGEAPVGVGAGGERAPQGALAEDAEAQQLERLEAPERVVERKLRAGELLRDP